MQKPDRGCVEIELCNARTFLRSCVVRRCVKNGATTPPPPIRYRSHYKRGKIGRRRGEGEAKKAALQVYSLYWPRRGLNKRDEGLSNLLYRRR